MTRFKATKDGKEFDVDGISVVGWGCIWIFLPWVIGAICIVVSILTLIATLVGMVVRSLAG